MGRQNELSQRRLERREDKLWDRNIRIQDSNISAQYRDLDAADDVRRRGAQQIESIRDKARQDAERVREQTIKPYAIREKELLSATRTAFSGATRSLAQPIIVWHWRAIMPPVLRDRLGVSRTDAGPLLALRPGGGLAMNDSIPDALVAEDPSLTSDSEFMSWAQQVSDIWHDEVLTRYQILARLRDDDWFAEFAEAVGIHDPRKDEEALTGRFGQYRRTVILNVVPSISSVEIDEDGLVVGFAHSPKASAKAWAAKIDLLRNGWRAAGMNSDHLRLTDDSDGGVRMHFDDAPSNFPLAIAPPITEPVQSIAEAKQRYSEFRWLLGVDARGNEIAPSIREVFHVLAIGGTGSGKSVWLRGLIESARLSGWRVYLGDGKMSDYPALENAAGVVMRSSDAAQHVVLVAEIHDEMVRRQAVAEQRKRQGHPNPFDFEPILLVLDEFASMRGDVLEFVGDKKTAMEPWLKAIAAISRKGRELKVHLVLASQDLYVENIPNQWQGNFQLLVSLGEIEDKTLDTKFIPDNLKDEAKRIGSRITRRDRGRGLFVDKSNTTNIRVTEFQSFYSYSPGSTSLAPDAPDDVAPPTAEVHAVWEQQRDAATLMPRLYSRVGIRVDDATWRDKSVTELMAVPTIALDDRDGNPIPNLIRYDQRSTEWLGREQVSVAVRGSAMSPADEPHGHRAPDSNTGQPDRPQGARAIQHAESGAKDPKPKSNPKPEQIEQTPSDGDVTQALDLSSFTPEQRETLLRELLSTPITETEAETPTPTTPTPNVKGVEL